MRPEAVIIARSAYARGYAVASLDSRAHITSGGGSSTQWNEGDTLADNADVQNAIDMVSMLRGELGAIPVDTPVFVIGLSNGRPWHPASPSTRALQQALSISPMPLHT